MAFADPQSVTINAIATSLPKVSSSDNKGVYSNPDQSIKLWAQHTYSKRVRRVIRLDHSKISVDPLMTNVNQRLSGSVYLVTDFPPNGYTAVEVKQLVDALTLFLTTGAGAATTKFVGGES